MPYFSQEGANSPIYLMSLTRVMENCDELHCMVLPGYSSPKSSSTFYFTTYIDGNFIIIQDDVEIIGLNDIRQGCKVIFTKTKEGIKAIPQNLQILASNKILAFEHESDTKWKVISRKVTNIYMGQSVVLYGYPHEGNSITMDKISKHLNEKGYRIFNILFAERWDDGLGENIINLNSQLGVENQALQFYRVLDQVVRDSHNGISCCLVIDSINTLISTNQSLGIQIDIVLYYIRHLFLLAGNFTQGSITILCTMNRRGNDITNDKIKDSLMSFSDAGIWVSKDRQAHSYSRGQ